MYEARNGMAAAELKYEVLVFFGNVVIYTSFT